MNIYQEFLQFSKDIPFKDENSYNNYYNYDNSEYARLELFLDHKYDSYSTTESDQHLSIYDLDFSFIKYFPIDIIIDILYEHIRGRSFNNSYYLIHTEAIKYIYGIWNKYINLGKFKKYHELEYPDNELYNIVQSINNHLIITANMNPIKYDAILKNDRKKYYLYYTHYLYAYYPLLENGDELILKLIDFVYLNDAQDDLMYGIYQMEPNKLYHFMIKFMLRLNKQETDYDSGNRNSRICFDLFCFGTGSFIQFVRILRKLYKYDPGFDLLKVPELENIYTYTNKEGEKIDYRKVWHLYERMKGIYSEGNLE